MTLCKLLASLCIIVVAFACAERRHSPIYEQGNSFYLANYLQLLEPLKKNERTRSTLGLKPDTSDQDVNVIHVSNGYQVSVTFCPDTQQIQEMKLLSISGPIPEDLVVGTWSGGGPCSHGRAFHFKTYAETLSFLQAVMDVLEVKSFKYSISYTTLR
jgi:hypothetical protein